MILFKLIQAWWTNSIYVVEVDVFVKTYPSIRCDCDKPTTKRDAGDIFQYGCAYGRCGFCKYERKWNE